MSNRTVLITGAIIAFCLAVVSILGTYYLYILPRQNEEKLNFEKLKYEEEQGQMAADKSDMESRYKACVQIAEYELQKTKKFSFDWNTQKCASYPENTNNYYGCITAVMNNIHSAEAKFEKEKDACSKNFLMNN